MALLRRVAHRQIGESAALWRSGARGAGTRCFATEQRKQEEERESFKGQLYQSTHERILREKEDQARFAQHREAEKAARGNSGLIIPVGRQEWMCSHLNLSDKV